MQRIGKGVSKSSNEHPREESVERDLEDNNPKRARITPRPLKSASKGERTSIILSQEIIPSSQQQSPIVMPATTQKGDKRRKTADELTLCKKLKLMTEMSDRLQRHPPKIRATMLLADWRQIPDPEGRLQRAVEEWEEETSHTLTQTWLSEIAIEMNAIIERHNLSTKPGMGALQRYLAEIPQYQLPDTSKPETAAPSGANASADDAGKK